MPDTYAVSDSPITKPEDDLYERGEFCSLLADELCLREDMPSVVIGLEGDWGSGKTSCINLAKTRLIKKQKDEKDYTKKPILVTFNPWRISTLDSLVEGFFLELASAIGTLDAAKVKNVARGILSFAKYLSPIRFIPGAEPWASLISSIGTSLGDSLGAAAEFAGLSLERRRENLVKSMEKMNRPVVVFIDDVDRLPPEEIRTLFQLIKCIADFPRVAYLVAYDPAPVIAALSYDGVIDGRNYLEKIVQVAYQMPRCGYYHRHIHLEKAIESLLQNNLKKKLDDNEQKLLEEVFKNSLFAALKTPRQVKRLLNGVYMASRALKSEVCFADILVLKILETVFPEVARNLAIPCYYDSFIESSIDPRDSANGRPERSCLKRIAIDDSDRHRPIKRFLDDVLPCKDTGNGNHDDDERNSRKDTQTESACELRDEAERILGFLFPNADDSRFREYLLDKNIHGSISNRVWLGDSFIKYLHQGIYSRAFCINEAKYFLGSNSEEIKNILKDHKNHINYWINKVNYVIADSTIINPKDLIEECVLFYANEDPEYSYNNYLFRFIDIINYKSNSSISNIEINKFLTIDSHFELSTYIVHCLFNGSPHKIQSKTNKNDLKNIWLDITKKIFDRDKIFTYKKPYWLLSNCFDLEPTETRKYLGKQLVERSWADRFLEPLRKQAESKEVIAPLPKYLPSNWFSILDAHFHEDPIIMKVLKEWQEGQSQEPQTVSSPSSEETPSS